MAGSEMRRRRRGLVGDDVGAGSIGSGSCTMGLGAGHVNISAQCMVGSWLYVHLDARQADALA